MSKWIHWLKIVSLGVALFGVAIAVAPGFSNHTFSLLIYGDANRIDSFGVAPTAYIKLAHSVLGGTLCGWGMSLYWVVRYFAKHQPQQAWKTIVTSVLCWYAVDTAMSVTLGFWPNALLNTLFAALFAIPLIAMRKHIA